MPARLEQQIQSLVEIDKVKPSVRRTRLFDHSRYENDAQHAWHLTMMAVVLAELASEPGLDVAKMMRMVLLHDLVEIDTGDLFLYDAAEQARRAEAEPLPARRIFGLLPEDQCDAFLASGRRSRLGRPPRPRSPPPWDDTQALLEDSIEQGWLRR